jgi:uncharacterized protein (TIGR03435 family)
MRRPTLLALYGVLLATAIYGQEITGSWQGMLTTNRGEARVVIRIATTGARQFDGMLYLIDAGGQGIPVNVSFQNPTLRLAVPALSASFEGSLNGDQNSFLGTWMEGVGKFKLELRRATGETAWAIPPPPTVAKPMTADADPSFEVATIKPSREGTQLGIFVSGDGRTFGTNAATIIDLVAYAYALNARQIAGAPSWAQEEKFDIRAKPDKEGRPSGDQTKKMVQKLIAERFQLTFHREMRKLPVYKIVIAKSGPKLPSPSADPRARPGVGFRGRRDAMTVSNATMSDFAGYLQRYTLDRPVVDATDLTGRYSFTLDWKADESAAGQDAGQVRDLPDFYTAMQEQLGLRVEAANAPMEVLVIDRVARPSEN